MTEVQKQSKVEDVLNEQDQVEVNFKYFKSNFYRIIHANGVIGGLSRRGEIHIGFYSERPGFPDSAKLTISQIEPAMSEQIEGGDKYIREIEVDAVVDLNTAKQIRTWLDTQIKLMEASLTAADFE